MLERYFVRLRPWQWFLLSVVAGFVLLWLLPDGLFLSSPTGDLAQMASWRAFASDSMRAGHFPLWNPYAYAGQPFLGDFQSAELYPLNVIFLFMPLARAMNFSFLLHLLILGWGVGYWATRRGCHPWAAALAGLAMALSGPVFPRLYAGHLANVCTMAWAPWTLVALETAWRGPLLRPLLLASAAVALQIFAGHPQYVFYVAIAAGLHAIVQTVVDPAVRWRAVPVVMAAYLGGAILAAAQLAPGFAAAAESVRQGPLDYNFARMFSLPPENLLTGLAPGFFGGLSGHAYWGRWYLWEALPYMGVAGVALAALAALDRERGRHTRCDIMVAVLLLVLALGDYTPLLHFLYDYAPGFDRFRSPAKFLFPLSLFGALAIAMGADALIRGRFGPKFYSLLLLVGGTIAVGGGVCLWLQPARVAGLMAYLQHSPDSYLRVGLVADTAFLREAGLQAGHSLALGGTLLATTGLALLLARWHKVWRWVPLGLLPLELVCFARANLATATMADLTPPLVRQFVGEHPGDYRVLNPVDGDESYFLGVSDLWGNDPTVLNRYAEFIAFLQGADPNQASQYATFHALPPALALVRFGVDFVPNQNQPGAFHLIYATQLQPRAQLVSNYQVLSGRDAIFTALIKDDFNPAKIVYLESEPTPRPQSDGLTGKVKVSDITSDSLTIEADAPSCTLLLITDLYSRDWRARALDGSVQTHYDVLPADYIVRAIPLAAGHHHLVVEYAPPSFRLGGRISGMAWLAWITGLAWTWKRHSS